MKRLSSALLLLLSFALLAPSCAGPGERTKTTLIIPTPMRPVTIIHEHEGEPLALEWAGQIVNINNHEYDLYKDANGREWIRDRHPPYRVTPRPPANPPGGRWSLNPRITSRAALFDFSQHTYAGLMQSTGLDRWDPTSNRNTTTGAQVLDFDSHTLDTHVVYAMRGDVGIPHPDDHPRIRFDIQMLAAPAGNASFLSVAVEGDLRDVAAYLLDQGITKLTDIPLTHADTVYDCDAVLDRVGRRVVLLYRTTVLRVVPLR